MPWICNLKLPCIHARIPTITQGCLHSPSPRIFDHAAAESAGSLRGLQGGTNKANLVSRKSRGCWRGASLPSLVQSLCGVSIQAQTDRLSSMKTSCSAACVLLSLRPDRSYSLQNLRICGTPEFVVLGSTLCRSDSSISQTNLILRRKK